ncbi:MAG: helix-turn-helix domain-containing protein, partial [Magnetococcales bacterium]|nr:helix-turn-helix domain-containing protein [Magnetococcales bacterium]
MSKVQKNQTENLYVERSAIVHPSVAQVGEALRQLREEKGLTLDEMARRTRVRNTYLQALEEGRIDILPGQVFVAGFLRLYARHLEFADTAMVEACVADLDNPRQVLPSETFEPPPASSHRPAPWMAVVGLLALGGLYVAYEYQTSDPLPVVTPPSPPNAAPMRVDNSRPVRGVVDAAVPHGDQSKQDVSSGKTLGQDDPSLWPATDSSPDRISKAAKSGSQPDAPPPIKNEQKPEIKSEP